MRLGDNQHVRRIVGPPLAGPQAKPSDRATPHRPGASLLRPLDAGRLQAEGALAARRRKECRNGTSPLRLRLGTGARPRPLGRRRGAWGGAVRVHAGRNAEGHKRQHHGVVGFAAAFLQIREPARAGGGCKVHRRAAAGPGAAHGFGLGVGDHRQNSPRSSGTVHHRISIACRFRCRRRTGAPGSPRCRG